MAHQTGADTGQKSPVFFLCHHLLAHTLREMHSAHRAAKKHVKQNYRQRGVSTIAVNECQYIDHIIRSPTLMVLLICQLSWRTLPKTLAIGRVTPSDSSGRP
jgi:hypothetical protein